MDRSIRRIILFSVASLAALLMLRAETAKAHGIPGNGFGFKGASASDIVSEAAEVPRQRGCAPIQDRKRVRERQRFQIGGRPTLKGCGACGS